MRTPSTFSRLSVTAGAFGKQWRYGPGHPGGTPPKRCMIPVRGTGPIPTPCEHRVHRAGRCTEHYNDWKAAKDARRRAGGIAVSPERREKKRLASEHGASSGRQLRKLRKELRREVRA